MTERVLRVAELVPPGRVANYGLVAAIAGTGPRQAGAVMSRHGADIAWWRIVNAAGGLPGPLLARALPRWREEGIPVAASGRVCRIRQCLVEEPWLRAAAVPRLRELTEHELGT